MAKKKFGLGGGGLDALLGGKKPGIDPVAVTSDDSSSIEAPAFEPETAPAPAASVSANNLNLPAGIEQDSSGRLWVDPELLVPNPDQPRIEFDPDELQELSDSIKEYGVIQPITIEEGKNGTFTIIAGERRTRASKMAGLKKVPVQLAEYSEQKRLEVALIENIQRADLNPIEEAKAYYKIMEMGGLKQDEVAVKVGKNRATVANSIRLLKLPENIQTALVDGTITSGHARAILMVKDTINMNVLFAKITSQGLTVRQAEEMAGELNNPGSSSGKDSGSSKAKAPAPGAAKDPDLIDVETKFIEKLGTKVQIKGDGKKGQLIIDYYNKDDLNRIYELIVGTEE